MHKHGLYSRLERLRAEGITPADGQYQVEQQHSDFMTERITEDTITTIRQRLQTYNNAIAQQTRNQLAAAAASRALSKATAAGVGLADVRFKSPLRAVSVSPQRRSRDQRQNRRLHERRPKNEAPARP